MKKTLALISIVLAIVTLSGCKSEEEKIAEQKHEQDMKNISATRRSVSTWVPPDLSIKKTDKNPSQEASK